MIDELTSRQIEYCMECGVCTGSCPVSRVHPDFSPRLMIKRIMSGPENGLWQNKSIWSCLSCARCSKRCPADINFPEFNRICREKAREAGNLPQENHHGILQAVTDLQTRNIKQKRTGWAEQAGKYTDKGEYFYFVGCLPFFEVAFKYLDVSSIETARSVLQLLNRIGIVPVISNDERCCGHDALWSGNEALFIELAAINIKTIKASGAKTVLFSCPEGYFTFKHYYPKYFGDLPFDVVHLTEFLARELKNTGISFKPSDNGVVTYQDPCRLGRWSGIYEEPRYLLTEICRAELKEMERNRTNAMCCGVGAWIECSGCSKDMQMDRLNEAMSTGAKTMVASCPKCRIHLTCAQSNTDLNMEVTDIFSYLANLMEG